MTTALAPGIRDLVPPAKRSIPDRWKNWAEDEEKAQDAETELQRIFDDATPFAQRRWAAYREIEAVARGQYEPTYYQGRTKVMARLLERTTDLVAGHCERELMRKRFMIDTEADREEDLECEDPTREIISAEMRAAGIKAESKEWLWEGNLLGTSFLLWWLDRVEDVQRNPRRGVATSHEGEEVERKQGKKKKPSIEHHIRQSVEAVSDYDVLYPERAKHPCYGQYLVIRLPWSEAQVEAQFRRDPQKGGWVNRERALKQSLHAKQGRVGGGGAPGVGAGTVSSQAGGRAIAPLSESRRGSELGGSYKTPWSDVAGHPVYEVLIVYFEHYLYQTPLDDGDEDNEENADEGWEPPVECLGYFCNGVNVELRESPEGTLPSGQIMRPLAMGKSHIIARHPCGSGIGDRGLEWDLFCTDLLRLGGDAGWVEYQPMYKGNLAQDITPQEIRTHPGKYIALDHGEELEAWSPNQTLAPQCFAFYRGMFGEASASVGASEALQGVTGRDISATQWSGAQGNAMEALDQVIDNFEQGIVESAEIVRLRIANHYDDEMVVKMGGKKAQKFLKVDPSDFVSRVRLVPLGAAESLRRKVQARENTALLSVVAGAAAQGALPKVNLEAGFRQHLQDLDWRGLDDFMPNDTGEPGFWLHEHWEWEDGGDPDISPADDDEGHIDEHLRFRDGDDYLSLSMTQQNVVDLHIMRHQKQWAEKRQKKLMEAEARRAQQTGQPPGGGGGGQPPGPGTGVPTPQQQLTMDVAGNGSGGLVTGGMPGQLGQPGGGPAPQLAAGF